MLPSGPGPGLQGHELFCWLGGEASCLGLRRQSLRGRLPGAPQHLGAEARPGEDGLEQPARPDSCGSEPVSGARLASQALACPYV